MSAFLQTNIDVATDFNVMPGVRFEWFDVDRQNRVVAAMRRRGGEWKPKGDKPAND